MTWIWILFVTSVAAAFAVGFAVANRRTKAALPPPAPTAQQRKLMGLDAPLDQKVSVTTRDWSVLKLALWRNKVAWDIVTRSAEEMVAGSAHAKGCPGSTSETSPCLRDCPDRETRMSALVVLNAARQFAPINVNRPADAPYYAPSREYYSSLIAELVVARGELEALRGKRTTEPPTDPEAPPELSTKTAPQLKEAT